MAAVTAHPLVRKAQFKECCSVVIPHFGTQDKRIEVRPRQSTKVAESDVAAGKNSVQQRIAAVRKAEYYTFDSSASFREDRYLRCTVTHGGNQYRNVLGSVFSVGVHYHNRIS